MPKRKANEAISYCRISGRYDERTASLDTQEKACVRKALEDGYAVGVECRFREKDSGFESMDDRPVLLKVRELVRTGRFGRLYVHNTDRLARDVGELLTLFTECVRHGCEPHFVLAPDVNTPNGKLILVLRGIGHEMEWDLITERTKRGRDDISQSGRNPGNGGAPYGLTWDRETRSQSPDPIVADIVREMFARIGDQGWSLRRVAADLNRREIPTPGNYRGVAYRDGRRCEWSHEGVRRIIEDPVYCGDVYTNRRVKVGKKKWANRPRSEWVLLADGRTEPLVPRDLFDRAQEAIRLNDTVGYRRRVRDARTRNETRFAQFRGMIRCARCGGSLRPAWIRQWNPETKSHQGGATKIAYICEGRYTLSAKVATCKGPNLYEADVADMIWGEFVRVLHDEDMIRRRVERINLDRPGEAVHRAALEDATRDLAAVENRLRNFRDALGEADAEEDRDEIRDRIALQRRRKDELEGIISRHRARLAIYDDTERRGADLIEKARRFRREILDPARVTPEERRHFYEWFALQVLWDGHDVTLRLDLGEEEPDLALIVPEGHSRTNFRNDQRLWVTFPVDLSSPPQLGVGV